MKNETSTPNILRPFRAGRRVDVFLGLKPQAESFCPFGAKRPPLPILALPGASPFSAFPLDLARSRSLTGLPRLRFH